MFSRLAADSSRIASRTAAFFSFFPLLTAIVVPIPAIRTTPVVIRMAGMALDFFSFLSSESPPFPYPPSSPPKDDGGSLSPPEYPDEDDRDDCSLSPENLEPDE